MSLRPCLLLAPPLFSLAGCVTFAQAPLPLACDARLQGRWLPIANNAAEAAKLTADDYAVVDGQCHATVSMSQDADKPARKAELQVSGFELGDAHYLALGEKDLVELFAATGAAAARAPGSSVTLVRYRIDGDTLTLETIDTDTVKRMVDQHRLSARAPDQFNYVITGDEAQLRDVLLQHPELFGQGQSPPMTMRRAPAAEPDSP